MIKKSYYNFQVRTIYFLVAFNLPSVFSATNNIRINRFIDPTFQSFNQTFEWLEISYNEGQSYTSGNSDKQKMAHIKLISQHKMMVQNKKTLEGICNKDLNDKGLPSIDYQKEEEKVVNETKKNFLIFYNKLTMEEKKTFQAIGARANSSNITAKLSEEKDKAETKTVEKVEKSVTKNEPAVLNKVELSVPSNVNYRLNDIHPSHQSLFEIISNRYMQKFDELVK
jgi:hypothetical protein